MKKIMLIINFLFWIEWSCGEKVKLSHFNNPTVSVKENPIFSKIVTNLDSKVNEPKEVREKLAEKIGCRNGCEDKSSKSFREREKIQGYWKTNQRWFPPSSIFQLRTYQPKPKILDKIMYDLAAEYAKQPQKDSLYRENNPEGEAAIKFPFDEIQARVDCSAHFSPEIIQEIHSHQGVANRIMDYITKGPFKGRSYAELRSLVDKYPTRPSGFQPLEKAIDHMMSRMKELKLENVRGEEASVPQWIRGLEEAQLLTPIVKNMSILGLGSSVSTPAERLKAAAIVVKDFNELDQRKGEVPGKIVVFNQGWVNYGHGFKYRNEGASRASGYGAIATLIRSVTPFSLYTPHTGEQEYWKNVTKIPVASITVEDAALLQRLQDQGEKLEIYLKMLDTTGPNSTSRNVIGEITGRECPQEYVAVSGHIDSWDVGQGVLDDGGGCVISMMALAALQELNLKPRRTLQAILWTAEERLFYGATAFAEKHSDILGNYSAMFESDLGTIQPLKLTFYGSDKGGCIVSEILKLTYAIGSPVFTHSRGPVSSDITIFQTQKTHPVNGISLASAGDKYFWYHHTEADTFDVANSEELDKAAALWAVYSYVVANLAEKLDPPPPVASSYKTKF